MDRFMRVSKRWYQKASDANDSFDQFISIWISFNAIYGRRNGQEFSKIKSIINDFDNAAVRNILSCEEVQFFCNIEPSIKFLGKHQEVLNTSDSQERLKSNLTRNPKEALFNLMFILNKVRNNLFHGDKRIESSRDVDIVKHAYPIVREIVKSHLSVDENMDPVIVETSQNHSVEKKLLEKIEGLKIELSNVLNGYELIPRNKKHPISILLDRTNIQGNAIEMGVLSPQQMEEIRYDLLNLYNQNKPEVLIDTEEVYHFVDKRMKEVIESGCTERGLRQFYMEFIELQEKYYDKGYDFKR
ncbi:methylamine utilization protein MauJ [Saccharococcus sp. Marseille-Q5394]|uniref:methylamine utilization protein MauJ n=1 Tax=Saccharococcus sp. Marseille-Q5394 TaxID=2972778 RepID=UPI0021C60D79|nr:methylamine utilization protein MauJ [Saccharococcus sp. Marseille-Q5394]